MRLPCLSVLLTAGMVFRVHAGSSDGRLDIYWIDSEGGGSTLLVTPQGESVLIDSGNPGGRDSGRIVQVATEVAHLKRIDHYITTHFHIDHFGGAAEVAARIPIGHVWDNGLTDADPDGNKSSTWPLTSKPYRTMPAGERHVVQPGTRLPLKPGKTPLTLQCLITRQSPWTPPSGSFGTWKDVEAPAPAPIDTSDNANSSAWILTFGDFRFYDGGDVTWNSEAKLVWPEKRVPTVEVYQVTHHGLEVSNHPLLIRALNPAVSVMNNGPTKGAAAQTIATLRAQTSIQAQYQIHKNVRPDGATNNTADDHIANLDARCEGHFIHASVEPEGRRYTIEIPSSGHSKTYTTRTP
jgi:beta-lactamase superfamily II metal-dependent hydrolase